jgi:hypothetical protein
MAEGGREAGLETSKRGVIVMGVLTKYLIRNRKRIKGNLPCGHSISQVRYEVGKDQTVVRCRECGAVAYQTQRRSKGE